MTSTKHPGGRPPRKDVSLVALRLTHETATLLKARAKAVKRPLWRIVEGLIIEDSKPPLSQESLGIAQDAEAFLNEYKHSPKTVKQLKKAFEQALVLARYELGRPDGDNPPDDPSGGDDFTKAANEQTDDPNDLFKDFFPKKPRRDLLNPDDGWAEEQRQICQRIKRQKPDLFANFP